MVSRGDDALLACEGRRARALPAGARRPVGRLPPGGQRRRRSSTSRPCASAGRATSCVPSSQFWWLHHYGELTAHLEAAYRRIYSDEHLIVFDLAPEPRPATATGGPAGRRERVLVIGTYDAARSAPPARLVEELDRSRALRGAAALAARGRRAGCRRGRRGGLDPPCRCRGGPADTLRRRLPRGRQHACPRSASSAPNRLTCAGRRQGRPSPSGCGASWGGKSRARLRSR